MPPVQALRHDFKLVHEGVPYLSRETHPRGELEGFLELHFHLNSALSAQREGLGPDSVQFHALVSLQIVEGEDTVRQYHRTFDLTCTLDKDFSRFNYVVPW